MSDSHLYTRLLLPKRHGYPLFHPQPFDDLPLQSRRVGTEIGDLGVVTSDGAFDLIFNICRAADDPVNRFGVPAGFEQLVLNAEDVAFRAQYHRPGSDVSNTRIKKRRLDLDATIDANVFVPLGAGAVVEISASSRQAAMLILPDGASRWDIRRLQRFRDYALKHAQSWYEFVNISLERMVESGDLYLVTGIDKSTSWSLAALENESQDCKISLKLKAAQVGSAGTSCAWEWESASCFADSGPRGQSEDASGAANQTVFLRGFKIAIRSSSWRRTAKVVSVMDSKPSDILSKSGFVPFSQPSGGGTTFFRNSTGQNRGSPSDEEDSVQYFPEIPKVYHPGSVISDHIFACCPDAEVAVVHDDDWTSVLSPNYIFPSDEELLSRISRKYRHAQTPAGGGMLLASMPTVTFGSKKSAAPQAMKDLSQVPCKFYHVGACRAGSSCSFSHSHSHSHSLIEPGGQKPVCGFFTSGNCKRGSQCKFAHVLPSQTMAMDRKNEDTRQITGEDVKNQDGSGDGDNDRNPVLAGESPAGAADKRPKIKQKPRRKGWHNQDKVIYNAWGSR
ncbi:hypothetical protein C8R46DRAFT_1235406 [Mycena filopes]|nr:hypothetical protein C8R46DRAFT_1235406 [Mycena filopes]